MRFAGRVSGRLIAASLLPALLGACIPPNIAQAFLPPAITANPIPPGLFLTPAPRVLSANITAGGSGNTITRIEVRINRDRDPAHFTNATPHVLTVPAPLPQAGNVVVTLPANLVLSPAQLVTATWSVDYMLTAGGNDTATVTSTVSTRQACSPAQVTALLRSLQTRATNPALIPQTLSNAADVAILAANGFIPTHGFRSFIGQGVAFIGPLNVFGVSAVPGLPHLLLYAPPPGTPVAALTEPLVPDFPYTLIGFAFAGAYDPAGPPTMGCMPREAWFVHEAGWHLVDGNFMPQTVAEASPGDTNPPQPSLLFLLNPLDPGFNLADPRLAIGTIWHPRLWDAHFFIRPGGVPVVSVCNPAPGAPVPANFFSTTLIPTCAGGFPQAPPVGTVFPGPGFFVRALDP